MGVLPATCSSNKFLPGDFASSVFGRNDVNEWLVEGNLQIERKVELGVDYMVGLEFFTRGLLAPLSRKTNKRYLRSILSTGKQDRRNAASDASKDVENRAGFVEKA